MAILKFHSSLHNYVSNPRLKVSLNSCDEVINFLKGTQPKLAKYINKISTGKTVENLMLCNSKGKVITREEYILKKPADDETLHIQKLDHYITGTITIPAGITLVLDDPFFMDINNHILKIIAYTDIYK